MITSVINAAKPLLIPDLGQWDRNLQTFRQWWSKMKLWTAAQLKVYDNVEACQVVIIQMGGKVEGFTMQLLKEAEMKEWPSWENTTKLDRQRKEELQTIFQKWFTKGNQLEIILKWLKELKQGGKEIKDYLLEFKNLWKLAKISPDHAMEILQQTIK